MIVGLVGFALFVNSLSVTVLCILHICWLVFLPFSEEPWLRDQFGKQYKRYCDRVPRFVGYQTVRPAKYG
jgi:protein-S-isoprenylcysteine O-methyltransferase Ste14